MDAYRKITDSLAKQKNKAALKLNRWPLESIPSNLLIEADHCNEELLHAIERNDPDYARQSIERAVSYVPLLERTCEATDKLNKAKRKFEKLPKYSSAWPIAERLLASADELLRQRAEQGQLKLVDPSEKVIVLSRIVELLASDIKPQMSCAKFNLTPNDLKMINQQISKKVLRLDEVLKSYR